MVFSKDRGFTLIELTVVFVIVGLLVAGMAKLATLQMQKEKADEVKTEIGEVQSALARFIQDETNLLAAPDPVFDPEAHYPCPADPALAPGDVGFGKEARRADYDPTDQTQLGIPCDVTGTAIRTATVDMGGGVTQDVYIGAIPFATLGLGSEVATDPYGQKYTYAVSENVSLTRALRQDVAQQPVGAITVKQIDESGAEISSRDRLHFIVVAHGDINSPGAYNSQGTINVACPGDLDDGGTREGENCDHTTAAAPDATFVDGNIFRSTNTANNNFYDDTVAFSLVQIDELWGPTPGNPNDIYTTRTGRVGINTDAPMSLLHIEGDGTTADAMIVEGGRVGIGTDDPKSDLQVDGHTILNGNTPADPKKEALKVYGSAFVTQDFKAGNVDASNVVVKNTVQATDLTASRHVNGGAYCNADNELCFQIDPLREGCPRGSVLRRVNSNSLTCVSYGEILAGSNCGNGNYLQGFDNSGDAVCRPITDLLPNCRNNQVLTFINGRWGCGKSSTCSTPRPQGSFCGSDNPHALPVCSNGEWTCAVTHSGGEN